MDRDTLALKVAVKPVPKECRGCVIRGSVLCSLCASLVEDSSGVRYISLRPFEGARWRKMDLAKDLIDAPPQLQSEGTKKDQKGHTGKGVQPETLHA